LLRRALLDGQSDGRGLYGGAAGGRYGDGVGPCGESPWTRGVGVDSAAAAAAENTQRGECQEQAEDAPAAGATREDEEEQTSHGGADTGREIAMER
jgi:hypothetical protein